MNSNIIYPFKVKSLPFNVVSLDAYIDKVTMCIHHDKIYMGYVEALNLLIKNNKDLKKYTICELIYNPYLITPTILTEYMHYAGGVYNHELFFENIAPYKNEMKEGFKSKVIETFGSVNSFFNMIYNLAESPICYNWICACINNKGKLSLIGLKDNNTTIPLNLCPLLMIDIAEHAYFIKYHNHKTEYVKNVLNIINYDVVEERLSLAMKCVN